MPIGGVAAYRDKISPAGVGFDIACGNKAVLLNLKYQDVAPELPRLMDEIFSTLSFGIGRRNAESVEHEVFGYGAWQNVAFLKGNERLRGTALGQLGTIGSGNHYVDLFRDEVDRVWIGVHFGSRGLGHTIASHFITEAGGNPNGDMDEPPVLLSTDSALGQDYLQAMELAGAYAYAGRDWVCDRVARILGGQVQEEVHNHHNYAWQEKHQGELLWVVRKGATPAFPGQRGFVGGSMGDDSVILEGVESPEATRVLYSTVHGAGRVMSRTAAAGKLIRKGPEKGQRTGGVVTPEMMQEWVQSKGVELRGAGCDESPHCYKRLHEVLRHHGNTVRVLHRLTPIGVCMAGIDCVDPYKD
jgi:tRNA-splicing ligase RtcB